MLISGIGAVNFEFFTNLPKPVGAPGGGMANAIVGTLELLALASIIGIPVGVLGGIFLTEYGTARVNAVLRFIADVLNGVPSIIWGVVVYGLIVLRFKSFSAYAGGLALGLIMKKLGGSAKKVRADRLVPIAVVKESGVTGVTKPETK